MNAFASVVVVEAVVAVGVGGVVAGGVVDVGVEVDVGCTRVQILLLIRSDCDNLYVLAFLEKSKCNTQINTNTK